LFIYIFYFESELAKTLKGDLLNLILIVLWKACNLQNVQKDIL